MWRTNAVRSASEYACSDPPVKSIVIIIWEREAKEESGMKRALLISFSGSVDRR
jgi:hypothetical protein